jgi:hypothetical protein
MDQLNLELFSMKHTSWGTGKHSAARNIYIYIPVVSVASSESQELSQVTPARLGPF